MSVTVTASSAGHGSVLQRGDQLKVRGGHSLADRSGNALPLSAGHCGGKRLLRHHLHKLHPVAPRILPDWSREVT